MKKINIWEFGSRLNVKVNQNFINRINNEIKEQFKTKKKAYDKLILKKPIPFSTFKSRIKRGYVNFIDVEILVELCKLLFMPLNELQGNIIAYKTRRGRNYIEKPKLPVKITPIFDMLIAHHIGDGCVINPGRNRKPYFSYKQYDKQYRTLYLKKIESVFGKLNYRSNYLYNNKTKQVYFPVACSELTFKSYNLGINSFKSEIARLPKDILKKDSEYQLAFLIGTQV